MVNYTITEISNKLEKYYHKEDSSYSFKSCIHPKLNYGLELPNRLWELIKVFMIGLTIPLGDRK